MVFAIELLIECRKGINIGDNEFEYRMVSDSSESEIEPGNESLGDSSSSSSSSDEDDNSGDYQDDDNSVEG